MANREKYSKIGRGAGFNDAVRKMDEYISDPSVSFISKFICATNMYARN